MAYWANRPEWQGLDSKSKAAAMALLEADARGGKIDLESAKNALGAMINRAARDGVDIGQHVSGRIYQPTIEDAQFARLGRILNSPEHKQLMQAYDDRVSGRVGDWVNGATHFLAPERSMLALESREPGKYRSWRGWTGFDANKGEYRGVVLRDGSHAFLAPEGAYSAKFGDGNAPPPERPEIASGGSPAAPQAYAAASTPTSAPETPTGGLLSFGAPAEKPQGNGGLLSNIGSKLEGSGVASTWDEQPKAKQQEDPMPELASVPAPLPQGQRKPADVLRALAVLQARSRLGTA